MNIQKITLSNPTDKNIYYSYTSPEGLEVLQKELQPSTTQVIWAIPNSLIIPQFFFGNLEITEEYVTLENSCDSTYCSQNCCQYRIIARDGSSYRYINCQGVEITGILDIGQSVLICTSNYETIVARASTILLLGCCTEFPPQTPSNTPTNTQTPTITSTITSTNTPTPSLACLTYQITWLDGGKTEFQGQECGGGPTLSGEVNAIVTGYTFSCIQSGTLVFNPLGGYTYSVVSGCTN